MKKQIKAVILFILLTGNILAATGCSFQEPADNLSLSATTAESTVPTFPEPTEETGSPTEPSASSEPPSEPTEITEPTEMTEPTETTEPAPVTLYTREELEALENSRKSYGPGVTSGGKRPPYADPLQEKYGKYGGNFIAPDNGCIYLTFDCGYEYNNLTSNILDTLKEKDVKAVFFVTMGFCVSRPDLVQRMIQEGHTVGNHSTTHPDMTTLTIDQMEAEIMNLHNYVLETFDYKMHLFRPPTGAYSTRSLAVAHNLGYQNVHWSFAYADWDRDNQPETNAAFQRVTESAHSGAIYLLHAVSSTNAAILGDVIDSLRNQGYQLMLFT